jgi:hypothetical protein
MRTLIITIAILFGACVDVGDDLTEYTPDASTPDSHVPTCDEQTEPAQGVEEVALAGEWVTAGVTYLCFPPDSKPLTWSQSPRQKLVDGVLVYGACARPRTPGVIEPIRWVQAVETRATATGSCGQ